MSWAGAWVNLEDEKRVFVIGEYCGHWLVSGSVFRLVPKGTPMVSLVESERKSGPTTLRDLNIDVLIERLENGHAPHGREAQYTHLRMWEALDNLIRVRGEIRVTMQAFAKEAIIALPDTKIRCDHNALKSAKTSAEDFLAALSGLEMWNAEHDKWRSWWSRVGQEPRLPDYYKLLQTITVKGNKE